jgi:hypothetical protein
LSSSLRSRAELARALSLLVLCLSCAAPSTQRFQHSSISLPARGGGRVAVTAAPTVRITGILALLSDELPEVDVRLENAITFTTVATSRTQLDGRFRFTVPGQATYRVCWTSAAVGTGCGSRFTVGTRDVGLRTVPVPAQVAVVHGRVLSADARPCWLQDSFFGMNVKTQVTITAAGAPAPLAATVANVQGEYAFAGVKSGTRYQVRADCELSSGGSLVTAASTPVVANVNFPNHAPRLAEMVAFDGGTAIARANPGATIKLASLIREADAGDTTEYLWRTIDGSGSMSGGNTPSQQWTLAPGAGIQTAYLLARDGRGGYAYKRFDIPAGVNKLTFSGRVIDETTMQPVSGANVEVSGTGAVTNAQGWFTLQVPPTAAPERYVLNVRHPQYALLSRIHDKESTGNTYELIRAQNTMHPPGAINVLDTGSSGPCGGGDKQTSGVTASPFRAVAKRGDRIVAGRPKSNTSPGQTEPCSHRGARILIPAGALVDKSGKVPTGPVQSSVATFNPARRTLPGDYRAVTAASTEAELLSYGALHAEFRDGAGNKLNLKPGTTAEVRVPVSAAQLPSAPPSIAIWSYDEKSGLWVEEGTGALQNTADGWMYVGKTKHFSSLNMDVAGTDPAQATCVRFELGASLAGWTNLVMRAYVSYAGQFSQVKETALDSAQYHAVFRIPYAPPAPPPNTLRIELRGTYLGTTVVLLDDIIATDAPRPKMTGLDLWPDGPDYSECGDVITLEADPVTLPYYGDIDATGRPAFLTGPYGQFLPEDGEQTATDYYETLDPGGATYPTLETWWTGHGFAADGTGGTGIAQYLNFNDLGFGRDMNCRANGADLACYVTNYGLPNQNLANADAAVAHDPDQRAATVAMEYLAAEPSDRRVRFYVYGGGDPATAGKLKFADLDGLGPKPVPHLCIVCHGGQYDLVDNNVQFARFREFDLPSFKYSLGRSWDFFPAVDTLTFDEKTQFANLNQLVRNIAPAASPIGPLIDAWYTGGFGPGTAPVKPTPPAGWNNNATEISGYHNVFAKTCRTCHVARDYDIPGVYITFNSYSDFQFTSSYVCDDPKVMPNAFVTYKNFWSDPLRVIEYASLTGAGTCD